MLQPSPDQQLLQGADADSAHAAAASAASGHPDCYGLTCMPLGRCLLVPVTLVLFGNTPAMKLAADMMVLSSAELRTSVLRRW